MTKNGNFMLWKSTHPNIPTTLYFESNPMIRLIAINVFSGIYPLKIEVLHRKENRIHVHGVGIVG